MKHLLEDWQVIGGNDMVSRASISFWIMMEP